MPVYFAGKEMLTVGCVQEAFEYECMDGQITICKYIGNEERVVVPERIEGYPVAVIGKYAFHNCRFLRCIVLPALLHDIGSHSFYDCRNLERIEGHDAIREIGDGAFKNCRSLHAVKVHCEKENYSFVKSLLSEINRDMQIHIVYPGYEVKLLFPPYLHDYEENTEARIINQVTYGMGVHYRECVNDSGIDYKKYDALFGIEKETEELKWSVTIALNRLQYAHELSDTARKLYKEYVQNRFEEIVEYLLKEKEQERLFFMVEWVLPEEIILHRAIDIAHAREEWECVSYLMDVQGKRKTMERQGRYEL